jgi:hypothetical protein
MKHIHYDFASTTTYHTNQAGKLKTNKTSIAFTKDKKILE